MAAFIKKFIIGAFCLIGILFGLTLLLNYLEVTEKQYSNFTETNASAGIPTVLHPMLLSATDIRYYFDADASRPKKLLTLQPNEFDILNSYLARTNKVIDTQEYKCNYGCDCEWNDCFESLHEQGFETNPVPPYQGYRLEDEGEFRWIFLDKNRTQILFCSPSSKSC